MGQASSRTNLGQRRARRRPARACTERGSSKVIHRASRGWHRETVTAAIGLFGLLARHGGACRDQFQTVPARGRQLRMRIGAVRNLLQDRPRSGIGHGLFREQPNQLSRDGTQRVIGKVIPGEQFEETVDRIVRGYLGQGAGGLVADVLPAPQIGGVILIL